MYISNMKLWNFRKFGTDADFQPDSPPNLNLNFTKGLNVIIGENDSGKSAIIDAIKLVLKTHSYEYIKVEHSDFSYRSNRFRIEIRFENLSPDEAKNFTEWLGWTGSGENAEPYLKVILDVIRKGDRILPSDIKAGVDEDGYQLTAEAREYLKATYLKPLRDAENELIAKKNSRLSQILIGDAAFKGKEKDHELVEIFNEFNENLKKYFKGELNENKEGKAIKDKIDSYIQQFYSKNHETEFETAKGEIKSILEKLTLTLKDELNPGLGTLNRLSMAAELLHLGKENWSGIRLGLIEELEAHLHPQAQIQVIETLQRLNTIQLILTTHSPNLASKVKLKNLIICNKGNAFPMGSDYTNLEPGDYKFLEKFLDITKANLFFAKGVILVEGWAEEILIPSIAKNIGINLTEKGVSIVNIGNLAFAKYVKIFIRKEEPEMKIPIAVITDSDVREYDKQKTAEGDSIIKRNSSIIKTETERQIADITAKSEKNVQYFIAPNWTLEYSLFKSRSGVCNIFKGTVKSIHSGTDWESDFEKSLAEKLINKTLKKQKLHTKLHIA
ncbi:MAG: AAA family ATPase [Bacteroidales bacterium]|nr:AAA family ATPase [Bacteroidales bacterium]